MYPKELTDPIKEEIKSNGVKNLETAEAVETFIKNSQKDNSVLLINSICGCAAGIARPGLYQSFSHKLSPIKNNHVASVFAGVDTVATEKAREYFLGYSPSSPSIGFFREGELVYALERHNIEGLELTMLQEVIESIYLKFFDEEIKENLEVVDPWKKLELNYPEINHEFEILDCRSEAEREAGFIPKSVLLDQELADEIIGSWDKNQKIACYCATGKTSMQVVMYFKKHGFKNIFSLAGGYLGYQKNHQA